LIKQLDNRCDSAGRDWAGSVDGIHEEAGRTRK